MNQWFRAYGETLNDPKIQRLPDAAFKAWHNALYLACNLNSKDGNIGTIDDVSFAFRETKQTVSSAFHTLVEAGLIVTVGETFQIVSWKKRQYKSDTSTERVKRHRQRSRNVTETAPDTDTDTDTDKKKPIGKKDGIHWTKSNALPHFEAFWSEYPRRAGSNPRAPALKKFVAVLNSGVDPARIVAAAAAYRTGLEADGKIGTTYVAQAITWLNQGRWNDDYSPGEISGRSDQRGREGPAHPFVAGMADALSECD